MYRQSKMEKEDAPTTSTALSSSSLTTHSNRQQHQHSYSTNTNTLLRYAQDVATKVFKESCSSLIALCNKSSSPTKTHKRHAKQRGTKDTTRSSLILLNLQQYTYRHCRKRYFQQLKQYLAHSTSINSIGNSHTTAAGVMSGESCANNNATTGLISAVSPIYQRLKIIASNDLYVQCTLSILDPRIKAIDQIVQKHANSSADFCEFLKRVLSELSHLHRHRSPVPPPQMGSMSVENMHVGGCVVPAQDDENTGDIITTSDLYKHYLQGTYIDNNNNKNSGKNESQSGKIWKQVYTFPKRCNMKDADGFEPVVHHGSGKHVFLFPSETHYVIIRYLLEFRWKHLVGLPVEIELPLSSSPNLSGNMPTGGSNTPNTVYDWVEWMLTNLNKDPESVEVFIKTAAMPISAWCLTKKMAVCNNQHDLITTTDFTFTHAMPISCSTKNVDTISNDLNVGPTTIATTAINNKKHTIRRQNDDLQPKKQEPPMRTSTVSQEDVTLQSSPALLLETGINLNQVNQPHINTANNNVLGLPSSNSSSAEVSAKPSCRKTYSEASASSLRPPAAKISKIPQAVLTNTPPSTTIMCSNSTASRVGKEIIPSMDRSCPPSIRRHREEGNSLSFCTAKNEEEEDQSIEITITVPSTSILPSPALSGRPVDGDIHNSATSSSLLLANQQQPIYVIAEYDESRLQYCVFLPENDQLRAYAPQLDMLVNNMPLIMQKWRQSSHVSQQPVVLYAVAKRITIFSRQ